MQYIDQVDLAQKRVFLRADLNVPFDDQGRITDDHRIRSSLASINSLLQQKASVILASHLGRPRGKYIETLSLKPVAVRLSELLGRQVLMAKDCVGSEVRTQISQLKQEEIILLENLRFHPEEEKNDQNFAQELSHGAKVYINDAFATSHRAHASIVAITQFIPVKVGGFTLKDEVEYFKKAFDKPERPFVVILGGAKISTKLLVIENLGSKADKILIGGAMANTFLAAEGYHVGESLFELKQLDHARQILASLSRRGCEVVLPKDVVVAEELKPGVQTKTVPIDKIDSNLMVLDIGPKTVETFTRAFSDAKTIIWNGPMGAFEVEEFRYGTFAIASAMARLKALTIVGGGDTDFALERAGVIDKMSFVSTAGGAFLELLEGKELPGLKALGGF